MKSDRQRRTECFEYVVAGGGSAGCIVAGRLAQAGKKVLLIEAGSNDRSPAIRIPGLGALTYRTKNWHYQPAPDPSRHGVVESWPSGKVLGGGGSINGMVFVRGHRSNYDHWAETGCTGWSYKELLPYFKRLENWAGAPSAYRGNAGPIEVCERVYEDELNACFRAAATHLGYATTPDYNGAVQEGLSKVQTNTRRGLRVQSSRAYLCGLPQKGCLTIRTDAFVRRIVVSGRRATGVEYSYRGETITALAEREVILCAGSIASPKILMLSGVGPVAALESAGIDVRHANESVGANLQEHSSFFLRWHSQLPNANNVNLWSGLKAAVNFAVNGKGLLSTMLFQDQIFCSSDPSRTTPDLQMAFANFALMREASPDGQLHAGPHTDTGVMVFVTSLQPRSSGHVRLRSGNPHDTPLIDHRMFGEAIDFEPLLSGIDRARTIMANAAFNDQLGGMFAPEGQGRTRDDWREYLVRNASYTAHPVGTCRMGSDAGAVVDPQLRVVGIEGLRVADASVMPTEISGNTNCPSMMIGERAAALILGTA